MRIIIFDTDDANRLNEVSQTKLIRICKIFPEIFTPCKKWVIVGGPILTHFCNFCRSRRCEWLTLFHNLTFFFDTLTSLELEASFSPFEVNFSKRICRIGLVFQRVSCCNYDKKKISYFKHHFTADSLHLAFPFIIVSFEGIIIHLLHSFICPLHFLFESFRPHNNMCMTNSSSHSWGI